ncbi:MAG: hypothetical protein R3234_04020 [Thermoanaerobaculia bacterium]|nr:hypothetical protein [Thermoanaerobaculia bacterium]
MILGLVLLSAGVSGPSLWADPICAPETHLTLVGADLQRGTILLSPGGSRKGASWIELDLRRDRARSFGGAAGSTLPRGGSVASGLVVAARECGPSCLQMVRWREGAWRGLGESLSVDAGGSLVETTYDGAGIPWVILRRAGTSPGTSAVIAYRIEGRRWRDRGRGEVRIAGSPFASPWPGDPRAVAVGDLRFGADAEPVRWLRPLPSGIRAGESQVFVLPEERPLLLTGPGDLYLGREEGGGWMPVRWRPWEDAESLGGRDLRVEILSAADGGEARGTVWIDVRDPDDQRLHLVEWSPRRGWMPLVELPDRIRTTSGAKLPYRHVLRLDDGRWALVVGCVGISGAPGIAWVELDGGELEEPRVVPIIGERRR